MFSGLRHEFLIRLSLLTLIIRIRVEAFILSIKIKKKLKKFMIFHKFF